MIANIASETVRIAQALREGIFGGVELPTTATPLTLTDYGGMVHRSPAILVYATCQKDIMHTLRVAHQFGVPVSVRGAGHSCAGQSLCREGITIVNVVDEAQVRFLAEDCVEVSARTRWGALDDALAAWGATLRVHTSHPAVTVGGTLSAGGYGLESVNYGGHVDQVESLLLITPDGTPVWCSPQQRSRLFRYSLSGLGQVGIIEKAVVRVRKRPQNVQWILYQHQTTEALIDSMAWLETVTPGVVHAFSAARVFGGSVMSLYGVEERWKRPFLEAQPTSLLHTPRQRIPEPPQFREDAAADAAAPPPRCPAADYVLPYESLPSFLHMLEQQWRRHDLQRYTPYYLILAIRHAPNHVHIPFAPTNFGQPGVKFLVGVYPVIPHDDEKGLHLMKKVLHKMLMTCLEQGGRPYLYGWHELDETAKRQLYADDYTTWQELRTQLDPENILTRNL